MLVFLEKKRVSTEHTASAPPTKTATQYGKNGKIMSLLSLSFVITNDDGPEIALTSEMLAGHGETTTAVATTPVKNQPYVPAFLRRLGGWGCLGAPIYFVVVATDGTVNIRSGRIEKMPDPTPKKPKMVTVRFDGLDRTETSPTTEIEVGDPNLMLADEIGLLRYPEHAAVSFGRRYSPETLAHIRQAARRVADNFLRAEASCRRQAD